MKKILSTVLVVALCLSLIACGSNANESVPQMAEETMDESAAVSEQETTAEEPAPTVEPVLTEEPVPTEEPTPTEEPAPAEEPFQMRGTIEETVLVDEKDIKVTATELEFDSRGAELSLLFENNSDRELSFTTGTLGFSCNSVNGYMVDTGYLNTTVQPGKKSYDTIFYRFDSLRIYGIKEIAEIGISIQVEDDDYNEVLITEPVFLRTSLAEEYNWSEESFSETVNSPSEHKALQFEVEYYSEEGFPEQGDIRILSATLVSNSSEEKHLMIEVENTSNTEEIATIGNIFLNGVVVCDSTWSHDLVLPGKKAVLDINCSYYLEQQGIKLLGLEKIGELAFEFEIDDLEYDALCDPQMVVLQVAEEWTKPESDLLLEEKGIRVYYLGLEEDEFSYSNDVHLFILIENNTEKKIYADTDWDSVSVDGFMIDDLTFTTAVVPGKMGIMDIELQEDSLQKAKIDRIEDIKNVEFTLKIYDGNYNTILNTAITALSE